MKEDLVGLEPRTVLARHLQETLGTDALGEDGYSEKECAELADFLADMDVEDRPDYDPSEETLRKLLLMEGLSIADADYMARMLPKIRMQRFFVGPVHTGHLLQVHRTSIIRRRKDGDLNVAMNEVMGMREVGVKYWLHQLLYIFAFTRRFNYRGGAVSNWPDL